MAKLAGCYSVYEIQVQPNPRAQLQQAGRAAGETLGPHGHPARETRLPGLRTAASVPVSALRSSGSGTPAMFLCFPREPLKAPSVASCLTEESRATGQIIHPVHY